MITICKNCGKENKSTNIKCEFCNSKLNNLDDTYNPKKKKLHLNRNFVIYVF